MALLDGYVPEKAAIIHGIMAVGCVMGACAEFGRACTVLVEGPKGRIGIDVDETTSVVRESDSWIRNLETTNDLNVDDFLTLKDNGVVRVNSSGSNRPLVGEPNSYYKTANGEYIFVYDHNGKLIYDISVSRVKINVDPNGIEHYQPYKLEGAVLDVIKELFGW